MDGESWTAVEAEVEVDSFDSEKLKFTLYAEDVDTCDFMVQSDLGTVFSSFEKAEGEYPLSLDLSGGESQTVTLYTPSEVNVIATEGIIHVESLSATEATIGLIAHADADNEVNGTFSASICP